MHDVFYCKCSTKVVFTFSSSYLILPTKVTILEKCYNLCAKYNNPSVLIQVCAKFTNLNVVTLALGSRLKQGLARLRTKREAWKSHHMLLGVQRVWGNEPSHSLVNSHCESWNPKWTPKSSEHNCRGHIPSVQSVFYIIGKLLKIKCLKWVRMTHLHI